ncbi:3-hydroxyacyl-CoA dehydrogenase [Desulfosalsimonas propionicica]|uniref:3-hydroxyacyl-CoA dehydrogenase n=1 Tax=Desulfosalsimonas propionicica TaxID=332175 RepID=A0A7W0C8F6_9BACT|nr:3-hydroxyacyl-CoA dehydrogenase NAD-binding domain-containing protein [Desulfosalsimonas propionicica]MBA2881056.1 3-hydroxyacyl-CoA dehydrogenase [Desulfosalsimonas propionicica]
MVAITEAVSLDKHGEIGMLWIDNPPVNALGHSVRKGLAEGIEQAEKDDQIRAVVVICKGRTFCAGADIREFGKPPKAPHLPDVLNRFDQCQKPIIAAIHGTAFGGGLETALSSHFRVAVASARFGLPEVKLGLLPGAGGTQRLPRLIGPEKALAMITSGNPIGADKALEDGLIHEIIDGDLAEGAVGFANQVLSENRPMVRVRDMTEKIAQPDSQIFDDFRKQLARRARGFEAPQACVDAVEAAVAKPFEDGLAYERQRFEQLMNGSQSAAQRYYFFAERQVARIPDVPKDTATMDIKKVGVIGAGTMGGGITMNFVNAGIAVTLVEAKQELLDRGLGVIRKNYDISASKGKIAAEDVDKRMDLITGTTRMEDLADADLVIEAVYENMNLKKEIFSKLDKICKDGAILATNTSYLDVNEIAAQTSRPESVLGLHFFSPANVMRLLEIVRAEKTTIPVLATAMEIAKKIKKIAVVVGVCYGFAGNRMFAQRKRECEKLILEGALPAQVDRVIYDFGFPMGPFALADLIGIDLGWDKDNSNSRTMQEVLCEQGRFGQKNGKGYYNYEQGSRAPTPAPEIDALIVEFSRKKGYIRREISDEEILQRCIYPIINEGAKILEEKIAVRPSDLDVIWVNGYGWPVYRGGPMFYADLVGLDKILGGLKKFQAEHGEDFKPAPLLEQLVSEGKTFGSLNA